MSVAVCSRCDDYVDTDFVCEGLFEDASPFRYWCPRCVENAFNAREDNDAIVNAMKIQDPTAYADSTA